MNKRKSEMIDMIKNKLEKLSDIEKEISLFFTSPNVINSTLVKQFPSNKGLNDIIKHAIEHFSKIQVFNKSLFNEIMKNIR